MKIRYPFIQKGKFIGSFEVVCSQDKSIPCYNIATARAIKQKIIADHENKKTRLQRDN